MVKIRCSSDIQTDSCVDGQGLRIVIWTQGCPHACIGCHNPLTHDIHGGFEINVHDITKQLQELNYHSGLTFSGGEPMLQPLQCTQIAKEVHQLGMNVWCYTGYTVEQLLELSDENIMNFLNEIDILVDGQFVQSKKTYDCLFRGSSNQRCIDVKNSLRNNEIITIL